METLAVSAHSNQDRTWLRVSSSGHMIDCTRQQTQPKTASFSQVRIMKIVLPLSPGTSSFPKHDMQAAQDSGLSLESGLAAPAFELGIMTLSPGSSCSPCVPSITGISCRFSLAGASTRPAIVLLPGTSCSIASGVASCMFRDVVAGSSLLCGDRGETVKGGEPPGLNADALFSESSAAPL